MTVRVPGPGVARVVGGRVASPTAWCRSSNQTRAFIEVDREKDVTPDLQNRSAPSRVVARKHTRIRQVKSSIESDANLGPKLGRVAHNNVFDIIAFKQLFDLGRSFLMTNCHNPGTRERRRDEPSTILPGLADLPELERRAVLRSRDFPDRSSGFERQAPRELPRAILEE